MKVDAKSEITITLPKNRNYDYYGHNRNYGTAKDNVVQYRVMPTVEISQGELIINGKGGEEEIIKGESEYLKYRLPEGVNTLEGASIKIDPKTLQLLINGKVVNKVAVGDDNISKPYVVSLPTFSTNANNPLYPGALYIGAIDSSYTIYEVYGESTKLDSRTTKFVIYDELGRPIEYVKSDKESYVSYLDKHEYIFSDISSGFQAYFGKDGNKIQVYNGDESLSVVPSSTVYHKLNSIFLVNLCSRRVIVYRNNICFRMYLLYFFHYTLTANVIRQTSKWLCTNNISITYFN